MVKQIFIGGIVGGIALFMWGFISWVVLSWHYGTVRQDAGVMEVVKNIDDHLPETGVYYFPPMSFDQQDPDAWKEWEDMHRDSSRGMIFYTAEVGDPMPPMRLVQGFLADVAACMMASVLLVLALPSLRGYRERVIFVVSLGVFAILSVYLIDGIFHNLPLRWTVGLATDTAIGWFIVGLILAAIVRQKANV